MEVKKTEHKGWTEAYVITLGRARMTLLTEVGPRIIALSLDDGESILFEDEETLGKGQGDAEWHIYGGHRLWVSPETPHTYAPDNSSCQVEVGDDSVLVTGCVDPISNLQRSIKISACGDRFVVLHQVRNTGEFLQTGALWALTCVKPDGQVFFPWGRPGTWDLRRITYWRQWANHGSDVESTQWKPGNDLFRVDPTGEEGKIGTACPEGWIGYQRGNCAFFKTFTHHQQATYPDDGCSLEVYTCERFIEMETLSPLGTIYPGETVTHEEQWLLTDEPLDIADADAARELVRG